MANDDYSPDIAPIDCAMELLSDIEEANETPILDLFQTSYIRLALMLCPGVKTIIPSPNVIYYEIEAVAASDISIAATGNPEAYDMLSEICPANIYTGQAIPKEMRAICSQLVCGQFKPPSRRDCECKFVLHSTGPWKPEPFGIEDFATQCAVEAFVMNVLPRRSRVDLDRLGLRFWGSLPDW